MKSVLVDFLVGAGIKVSTLEVPLGLALVKGFYSQ